MSSILASVHTRSIVEPMRKRTVESPEWFDCRAKGGNRDQERKLLGSRRLAKAARMVKVTPKDERNEKLAFETMINSLQVVR